MVFINEYWCEIIRAGKSILENFLYEQQQKQSNMKGTVNIQKSNEFMILKLVLEIL